jgi:hypothetical protein
MTQSRWVQAAGVTGVWCGHRRLHSTPAAAGSLPAECGLDTVVASSCMHSMQRSTLCHLLNAFLCQNLLPVIMRPFLLYVAVAAVMPHPMIHSVLLPSTLNRSQGDSFSMPPALSC